MIGITFDAPLALLLLVPLPTAWAQDRERDPFGRMFGEDRDPAAEDDLPEEPVERAAAFVARGRHDEAEALLRAALENDGADPVALLWIYAAFFAAISLVSIICSARIEPWDSSQDD